MELRLKGNGRLVLVPEFKNASLSPSWAVAGVTGSCGRGDSARSDFGLKRSLKKSGNGMSITRLSRRVECGLEEDTP